MDQPIVELVITDDLGETTTEHTQREFSDQRVAELSSDGLYIFSNHWTNGVIS